MRHHDESLCGHLLRLVLSPVGIVASIIASNGWRMRLTYRAGRARAGYRDPGRAHLVPHAEQRGQLPSAPPEGRHQKPPRTPIQSRR